MSASKVPNVMMRGQVLEFRAFYKGTSLSIELETLKMKEFCKMIVKGAQMLIQLDEYSSLEEARLKIKAEMDEMEEGLCRNEDKSRTWTKCDQNAWVKEAIKGTSQDGDPDIATYMWFARILALLKLKVIENDDMNGWLIKV